MLRLISEAWKNADEETKKMCKEKAAEEKKQLEESQPVPKQTSLKEMTGSTLFYQEQRQDMSSDEESERWNEW